METPPVSPEAIHLSPEAQRFAEACETYLNVVGAKPQLDDEERYNERYHITDFHDQDESSLLVRQYLDSPDNLYRISSTDKHDNWASVYINRDGQLVVDEVEDDGPEATKARFFHRLEQATEHERARVAEKAEARIAEVPQFGELTPLDLEESQTLLERYIEQEDGKDILVDILITEDMLPIASQQLSETVTAHYTRIFLDNGRLATVAYVETKRGIIPQYYYLSNSQVAWRLLPGHETSLLDGKEQITRYNKGDSEHALTLPAPMQQALAAMSEDWHYLDRETADDLKQAISLSGKTVLGARYQDKVEPLENYHVQRSLKSIRNIDPEKVVIGEENAALAPNYAESLGTWEQPRFDSFSAYSKVTVEVVPSHDDTLHYVYITDHEGRVWLGGVDDVTAPVRPNGLRQGYIDLGVAEIPAMEKESQAGNYAFKLANHGHVDVYQKFLSKVPLIKGYADSRGIQYTGPTQEWSPE